MQAIQSSRTALTPDVIFRPAQASLYIEGECFPENPMPFFEPIARTLKAWFDAEQPARFTAEFRLQYVNSASTKGFRALFALMDHWGEQGTQVHVIWCHDADDDAMLELGEDLAEDFQHLRREFRAFEQG